MRAALLTVAVLALAAPAQAQERLCQPPPVPPRAPTATEKEQAELELHAARRDEFGLRHDLPYVKALLKRDVWWEYDRTESIPVTRREIRYLELRNRLWLSDAAARHLARQPDLDGGTSLEDAWPKQPYLLVRVTRDPAKHLAALKRLVEYPDNLRTIRVRYSEPELRRLGDRIFRDGRELSAAGLHVQGVDVDVDANRTVVELATTRTDAAAYFAQRYGPRVKTVVTATTTTQLECNAGRSFEIAPDGVGLTVSWRTYSDLTERLELAEFADRVEIGIVERVPTRMRDGEGTRGHGSVALRAPLGDRAVIDAKSGKPMLQVGPGPGDPPCPSPPPRPPERPPTRLEQAIATRRAQGLRADPAYVRQRLRSGALYTRAELRWLAQRSALEFDRVRVEGYTSAHADEYGGSSIEGTFPARPYVVYRWTGHRARHEAALKRLSKHPGRVRTATAQHSRGEINDLEERSAAGALPGSRPPA